MGVTRIHLQQFLREAKRRAFSGSLLCLGRQDVHFDIAALREAARENDFTLSLPEVVELSPKKGLAKKGFLSDQTFFKSLGFNEVRSLDFSSYEAADTVFDLNEPQPPDDLRDRFDAIFNGGTLEHVFHLPNALTNLHALLRTGGRTIHSVPVSNAIDHGFYCLQPTLLLDYYRANRYEVGTTLVVRFACRPARARSSRDWTIYNYSPSAFRAVGLGGLDGGYYMCFSVVTKREESTADQIPQQGSYVSTWDAAGDIPIGVGEGSESRRALMRRAERMVRVLYARLRGLR